VVDRIGQGGSLARSAIEAALKRQAEAVARMKQTAEAAAGGAGALAPGGPAAPGASDFSTALSEGVSALNSRVRSVDQLPIDVLSGKVTDFHEVAARLKESELSMRFSLEVRNKLIDAYREIMRMSV
jgi:flagellar hook-basal body complex protein FliE